MPGRLAYSLPVTRFGEHALREVHPLGQLRHFLPHLVQLVQDLVLFVGIHAGPAVLAGDALCHGRGHRPQHPERAPEKHECRDRFGSAHWPPLRFARSRSVKSTRSPSSATSWRTCCSSCITSSRNPCRSSRTAPSKRAPPRIRSASDRTRGSSKTPPTTMIARPMTTAPSGGILRSEFRETGVPMLGEQSLGEVDALAQLAQLAT